MLLALPLSPNRVLCLFHIMNSSAGPPTSEHHERRSKLFGAYTAFIAALLVAVFAKSGDYPRSWIVVSLLAGSLPSLVAGMLLDYIVLVQQRRRKSIFRGLAFGLGFVPSLIGVAVLVGHFSRVAAVLFLSLVGFWCVAIVVTAFLGTNQKSEV